MLRTLATPVMASVFPVTSSISDYTILRIRTEPDVAVESRGQVVNRLGKDMWLELLGHGSIATVVNINLIERRVRTEIGLPPITRKGAVLP